MARTTSAGPIPRRPTPRSSSSSAANPKPTPRWPQPCRRRQPPPSNPGEGDRHPAVTSRPPTGPLSGRESASAHAPRRHPAARPTEQGEASPMSTESKDLRSASLTLLLPLYIAVVFSANYFGALHAPEPHGVKGAIVPHRRALRGSRTGCRPAREAGFEVLRLTSVGQAREL